ncbi:H(+)-transporting V0 sector ATPase subunit a, partial [Cladochytrium tenue]
HDIREDTIREPPDIFGHAAQVMMGLFGDEQAEQAEQVEQGTESEFYRDLVLDFSSAESSPESKHSVGDDSSVPSQITALLEKVRLQGKMLEEQRGVLDMENEVLALLTERLEKDTNELTVDHTALARAASRDQMHKVDIAELEDTLRAASAQHAKILGINQQLRADGGGPARKALEQRKTELVARRARQDAQLRAEACLLVADYLRWRRWDADEQADYCAALAGLKAEKALLAEVKAAEVELRAKQREWSVVSGRAADEGGGSSGDGDSGVQAAATLPWLSAQKNLKMGTLFRSEEMTNVQLYIPMEIAQQTVAELGDLGLIQFRDLNPDVNAFQRTFVNEIRRLDEMERKLRYLRGQIDKAEIPIKTATASVYARARTHQEIDELEERLAEHEGRIQQMNTSQETLNKRFLELTELRHVLKETTIFFEEADSRGDGGAPYQEDAHLLEPEAPEEGRAGRAHLGFVAGVIPRVRMGVFERILFRALRGNLYMNYAEIDEPIRDPVTDELVQKNVFIIFAHGRELLAKIRKICESLGATLNPVDENAEKRRQDAQEVHNRLEDLKHVLDNTSYTRRTELIKVSETIEVWSVIVKKEKAVYYTLNHFNYDQNRKALLAEGWCPTSSLNQIRFALRSVVERTGSTIPPVLTEARTTKTPPTYHKTNKFTVAFQEIVDAYGMASYREVNPGIFTIITFPFLFAIMFGDLGHGFLMTLAAVGLIYAERFIAGKKLDEISEMFYGGRYIILLMGLFSMYTGFVYNDIFSKSMNLFGSGWEFPEDTNSTKVYGEFKHPYAFGVDPGWHGSENILLFSNSYKMKMAVILGVTHMVFGTSLNIYNSIFFNRPMNIITETVPQLLYLLSIFGYLAFMIIFKWASNWDGREAPSILNTLIYMFLSPGTVSTPLFPGQGPLQVVLLLLAFICIPWMLLAKPYMLRYEHYKHLDEGYTNLSRENLSEPSPSFEGERPEDPSPASTAHEEMNHEEHFDFSEIMIHQIIHTIEFCLNGISNTAS